MFYTVIVYGVFYSVFYSVYSVYSVCDSVIDLINRLLSLLILTGSSSVYKKVYGVESVDILCRCVIIYSTLTGNTAMKEVLFDIFVVVLSIVILSSAFAFAIQLILS